MKVILITSEVPYENEVEIISEALGVGLYRCHLRRPHLSVEETRAFLDSFSPEALAKIVLHDHHQLAKEYPVAGIHFNQRHPFTQRPIGLSASISCHSLEEVEQYHDQMDYLFLSPIFNSISKPDYPAQFSLEQLRTSTIIDERVIALGGISLERLPQLHGIPFGGVALLGDFWSCLPSANPIDHLRNYLSLDI
ncbi:Thiamine monophosphate synthase [Chlamydia trachomatis]|nr:Thiamine monophosphate synthase [Chlamydia trachomatis]